DACPVNCREGAVKQAEEASFVDLIACERDCRNCSYAAALDCDGNCGGGPPPKPVLPRCKPRRRPEQDCPPDDRAQADPAPGSPGPELGGRIRHPRPGRADPSDIGEALTSRPSTLASANSTY